MAHGALRRYLRDRPKAARLAELARELRVWTPLSSALLRLDGTLINASRLVGTPRARRDH